MPVMVQAQNAFPTQETFGKNRIQYRAFHWKVLNTQNFEVYFHEGGQQTATLAIQLAENEFDRITEVLGYSPFSRTKIFIYNAVQDLHQSNVGLSLSSEKEVREENLSKSRIEIAYSGNAQAFRKDLIREIARVFIHDMLYGGSIKESLQNSLLLSVPEWFMNGITAYIAEGWTTEMDAFMTDAILNQYLKRPNLTTGKESELVGQSIWNFVAEKYGRDNISNILNLTRIIRNEQTAIASTMGMPFSRFLKEWREYYKANVEATNAAYHLPQFDAKITAASLNATSKFNKFKLSPDGNFLAYSKNDMGKSSVEIVNLKTKTTRTLLSTGFKTLNQSADYHIPLLAWTKSGSLAVVSEEAGQVIYYIFSNISEKDLTGRLETRKVIKQFEQITDFDISSNGATMVLSAQNKGQNDLFLLDMSRGTLTQLTNDFYDDLTPRFIGKTNKIVFSTNRLKDSLDTDKGSYKQLNNPFKLVLHEGKAKTAVVSTLVDSLGNATNPLVVSENNIYFLSDEKGIKNIYRLDIGNKTIQQLSDFRGDIQDFDYNSEKNSLVYRYLDNGQEILAYQNQATLSAKPDLPFTNRNIRLYGLTVSKTSASTPAPTPVVEAPVVSPLKLEEGEIDTDNYQFNNTNIKNTPSADTKKPEKKTKSERIISSKLLRKDSNLKIKGPFDYQNAFVVNGTETDFVIDPLPQRGFGLKLNLNMNDLLENHLLKVGGFITPSLKNSDLWAEYTYLGQKIDYSIRVDRRVITDSDELREFKYRMNKIALMASYPINTNTRVSVSPFFVTTRYYPFDLLTGNTTPYFAEVAADYVGAKAEFVYDNTISYGINQWAGTRLKAKFEHYTGITSAADGFNKINLDLRHYIRIGKGLTFAFRGAAGHSFGNAPKTTVMGGMDNWVEHAYDNSTNKNDPFTSKSIEKDLLFVDFATPLRGFNLNKIAGVSYMSFNTEIRFPIAKYLYSGPIYSNFFKNLQFSAFTDIGTAWTGGSPFARRNSFNTYVLPALTADQIAQGISAPLRATVTDFRNPFLIGYGGGVRTTILGYFVKFDVGWGLENREVKQPISYLTLGYDF